LTSPTGEHVKAMPVSSPFYLTGRLAYLVSSLIASA
jgi:hypothetical protein